MRGTYITVEGGEHMGKSTQAAWLADVLNAEHVQEPGTTPIGLRIRESLLDPELEKETGTQVLLHAAQRRELAKTVIEPTLAAGRHVVSDRSWLSSAAYQGVQGISFERIYSINKFALGKLITPDVCILLDADPNDVKRRVEELPGDYYEQQDDEFHQKLRERFLTIGKELGAVIIDALQDKCTVSHQILQAVEQEIIPS